MAIKCPKCNKFDVDIDRCKCMDKKYQIILADPPWSYQDQGCSGTMADHYKGMKLEDIKKLPVGG